MQGFDSAKIVQEGYKRYNLSLGVGLSEVAGKVFRCVRMTAGTSANGSSVQVLFYTINPFYVSWPSKRGHLAPDEPSVAGDMSMFVITFLLIQDWAPGQQ